eukprot:365440-Rhodomonas_salina.1
MPRRLSPGHTSSGKRVSELLLVDLPHRVLRDLCQHVHSARQLVARKPRPQPLSQPMLCNSFRR